MKSIKLISAIVALLVATMVQAQTEKMSINDSWRFHLGDVAAAGTVGFQDNDWEHINLPHTWNIDAYTVRNYHQGIGWYRKVLQVPQRWQGKRIYLYFESAGKAATPYINGRELSEHQGGYTAFCYDITDYLNATGDNVLAVKVDNARPEIIPNSADFTFFGGINRDVWLMASDPIHFDLTNMASDGVFVSTPQVSEAQATVSIRGTLKNETAAKQNLELEYALYSPAGALVQSLTQRIQVKAGEDFQFQALTKPVLNPQLWTPETPNLYTMKTTLKDRKSGRVLDERTVNTAFRWFSFDAAKGFYLNGKAYKLRGMCRHQDQYPVGSALSDEMHRRDMLLMKAMGTNFIRISHYPQDEAILEMCDKLGMLVWEEVPTVNSVPDLPHHNEYAENNLREMIRQHYNHPSVILWGYMNEILLLDGYSRGSEAEKKANHDRIIALAKSMEEIVDTEDPTRLSTMAFNGTDAYNQIGISEITDVVGWNIYNGWYGESFDDFDTWMSDQHRDHPTHPMIVSEYGAGSDTRLHSLAPIRFDFSSEYQQLYIEHYVPAIEKAPYIMGGTYWNFIDFSSASRAESTPRINNKGITYNNRTPKDVYYYFQAYWRTDIPVLHIASRDWNIRAGIQQGNQTMTQPVKIYTNLPSVELFMDGKSLGTQRAEDHIAIFQVPFQAGEPLLIARGTWQGRQIEDALRIQFTAVPAKITAQNVDGLELGVNVGSNCFFTSDVSGFTWVPDQPYTEGCWGYLGGTEKTSTSEINATHDGPLYQSQRSGIEGYRFDVPKGTYEVELHFAEFGGGGRASAYLLGADSGAGNTPTTFSVSINGQTFDTLSPSAQSGPSTAMVRKYIVKNDTDHIEVCFDTLHGEAYLSGIKILKH